MLHQRLLLIASLAISTVALPTQQQSTDFSNVDDSIISAHATLPESAIRRGLEDSNVELPEVTSALNDEVLLDDEEWVDDESAIDVAIDDTDDLEVPETAAVSDENLDQTVDTIVAREAGRVKKPFRRSELADAVSQENSDDTDVRLGARWLQKSKIGKNGEPKLSTGKKAPRSISYKDTEDTGLTFEDLVDESESLDARGLPFIKNQKPGDNGQGGAPKYHVQARQPGRKYVQDKNPVQAREPGRKYVQDKNPVQAREPGRKYVQDKNPVQAREPGRKYVQSKKQVQAREPGRKYVQSKKQVQAREPGRKYVQGKNPVQAREPGRKYVQGKNPVQAREPGRKYVQGKNPVQAR